MAKLKPITRKEKYLAKAGGQSVAVPLPSITREERFLKDIIDAIEAGGESSDYAADIDFGMNSQTFVVTAQLKNKDGDLIGTPKSVDIPLESTVVNGSYNNATKTLTLTLVSGQSINIPIGDIISGLQAEITAQNPLNADLVDDSTSTNKFVTATEKQTWNNKQNALTFDFAPTKGSLNPVFSMGIYTALAGKQDAIDNDHKLSANLVQEEAQKKFAYVDTNGNLFIGGTQITQLIDQTSYDALVSKDNVFYLVYPTPANNGGA